MAEMNTSKPGDPNHQFAPASSPTDTGYRHARPRPPLPIGSARPVPAATGHNIVVVGVCSSGKSTLVHTLQEKGIQAHAVSQEHSYVPHLWQRTNPDVLIYLDASL